MIKFTARSAGIFRPNLRSSGMWHGSLLLIAVSSLRGKSNKIYVYTTFSPKKIAKADHLFIYPSAFLHSAAVEVGAISTAADGTS
jgi:hypothetical protein